MRRATPAYLASRLTRRTAPREEGDTHGHIQLARRSLGLRRRARRGIAVFGTVGCALCHTPTLRTGNAAVAALRNQDVNLYSDLLVHDMGVGLADGVTQGQAGPREQAHRLSLIHI